MNTVITKQDLIDNLDKVLEVAQEKTLMIRIGKGRYLNLTSGTKDNQAQAKAKQTKKTKKKWPILAEMPDNYVFDRNKIYSDKDEQYK